MPVEKLVRASGARVVAMDNIAIYDLTGFHEFVKMRNIVNEIQEAAKVPWTDRYEEVLERYKNEGWKHYEGKWIYKNMESAHIGIIHLCKDIGFCMMGEVWTCTSCGDPVPFALKLARLKY